MWAALSLILEPNVNDFAEQVEPLTHPHFECRQVLQLRFLLEGSAANSPADPLGKALPHMALPWGTIHAAHVMLHGLVNHTFEAE